MESSPNTTDSSGNMISELRYSAWGEVRYQAGTSPTKYTYTGQYDNTADFGLMYYNARWYDPSLGRFAQADSIVPAGVQGLDRYAYVNNNPVRYTDPTGHCPGCAVFASPPVLIITALVVAFVAFEVAINPEIHDAAVESISSGLEQAVEMAKRRDPKQKTIDKINANINIDAESPMGWWPGRGYSCLKYPKTCVAIILGTAKVGADLLVCGDIGCNWPSSNLSDIQTDVETESITVPSLPNLDCAPYLLTCPSPQIPGLAPSPSLQNNQEPPHPHPITHPKQNIPI